MLRLLVGRRFQVLFPPPGVLFTFPRGTSALSVWEKYLGLEGGPPASTGFHVSTAVLGHRQAGVAASRTGLLTPLARLPTSGSARASLCDRTPAAPTTRPGFSLGPVLASSRSLATTESRFDFSSSGYLDVSSSPGCPPPPMCSGSGATHLDGAPGFSHSETRGSRACALTADYRNLPRPSSASCAKASAACPYIFLLSQTVWFYDSLGPFCGAWVSYCMRCDLLEKNLRWCAIQLSKRY